MSFLGNLLEEVFLLKLDIQSGRCRTQEIKDLERQEGQRLPGNGKQRVKVTTVEQLDRQKQTREIQGEFLKEDGARGHPNVLAGQGCLLPGLRHGLIWGTGVVGEEEHTQHVFL